MELSTAQAEEFGTSQITLNNSELATLSTYPVLRSSNITYDSPGIISHMHENAQDSIQGYSVASDFPTVPDTITPNARTAFHDGVFQSVTSSSLPPLPLLEPVRFNPETASYQFSTPESDQEFMTLERQPIQGFQAQGPLTQGIPIQGFPTRNFPEQAYPAHDLLARNLPAQGLFVQDVLTQGLYPQGLPAQNFPSHTLPVQNFPPQPPQPEAALIPLPPAPLFVPPFSSSDIFKIPPSNWLSLADKHEIGKVLKNCWRAYFDNTTSAFLKNEAVKHIQRLSYFIYQSDPTYREIRKVLPVMYKLVGVSQTVPPVEARHHEARMMLDEIRARMDGRQYAYCREYLKAMTWVGNSGANNTAWLAQCDA
ncbi:hypothetical protein B0J11DRAFT_577833 [Dendryphion nanum]|uniref:Uncharacterized protein n=1 Tax=Dendryphion nanum TaxID=256645 RepID=A0A9P9E466_9PLEO|nr:hypothetical protein B0J11DRAFT_577833 [Dendryphion nanum]